MSEVILYKYLKSEICIKKQETLEQVQIMLDEVTPQHLHMHQKVEMG